MNYKNRTTVVDENIKLASPFIRLLAFLVDITCMFFLYWLISKLLNVAGFHIENVRWINLSHVEIEGNMTEMAKKTLVLLFTLLPPLYFCLSVYFTNGKTIGKKLFRIRIVSLYHHRIGFWHCMERGLGYAASVLELGLGFIQVFWNPNRMALHDRIAETIVVKEIRVKTNLKKTGTTHHKK